MFSRDGALLLSGNQDTTAPVRDLLGRRQAAAPLGRGKLETAWADLASEYAAIAQQAVRSLAANPDHAFPFIAERLQPVKALEVKKLEAILADLGSGAFAVRDRASTELQRFGEAAESAVHTALVKEKSLDVQRRLKELLKNLQGPQRLRSIRALQVLESSGTPDARKLLQRLSQGLADAWLTKEAMASVQRLSDRP